MRDIACQHCRAPFSPSAHGKRRYCSAACQRAARVARRSETAALTNALLSEPIASYDVPRPITRADCRDQPRPCPWVSCRHHLYLDVTPGGTLKLNHPGIEPNELAHSCSLDVAERGGMTLDEVSGLIGVTREGVRQIETRALVTIRRHRRLEPDEPEPARHLTDGNRQRPR